MNDDYEISLNELFSIIMKRKIIIIAIVLLSVIISGIVSFYIK